MISGIERALIFDYDNSLIVSGANRALEHEADFDTFYFRGLPTSIQEKRALLLIQHLVEDYLQWSPEMARDHLTLKILKNWGLGNIISKVAFPDDLDKRYDMFYLAGKIWPERIRMNAQDIYLQVYRRILHPIEGKIAKFPKGYFYGINGVNKACVCLKYAIENYLSANSVEELYDFFGTTNKCSAFIRRYKLAMPMHTFFDSYVEYFHNTLHPQQKNQFLFFYYDLWQRAENERRALKKQARKAEEQ